MCAVCMGTRGEGQRGCGGRRWGCPQTAGSGTGKVALSGKVGSSEPVAVVSAVGET